MASTVVTSTGSRVELRGTLMVERDLAEGLARVTSVLARLSRPDPVESGGRAVGEHRSRSAREDGRQPVAVLCEVWAAYCVYATVDSVQPAVLCPLRNGGLAQPEELQLGKGDQPVLELSQGDDRGLEGKVGTKVNSWLTDVPRFPEGRLRAPLHCP
jgi:hypothetical protein